MKELEWIRVSDIVEGFLASGFRSVPNGHVDVAEPGKVASDSGVTRRSRKRKVSVLTFYMLSSYVIKLVRDDTKQPLTIKLKIPPRHDKRLNAETNARKLGGRVVVKPTVEHGASDGPEHRQRSATKSNAFPIVAGASLVPQPGILSSSNPNPTYSVGADERAPKRANPKKKLARSGLNTSRTTDLSQTLDIITEYGIITELDYGMDHTAARVHESHVDKRLPPPAFTFNNAEEMDLEEEGYPYDSTLSEYPVLPSVIPDKEPRVSRLPRPKLPLTVTPPIWAQVRQIVYEKDNCYMAPSLDRKCASPLTTSGVIKVVSIIPMTSSKDIFLEPTHPGRCIH